MDSGSYSFTTESATCSQAGEITHTWTVDGIPVSYVTTNLKLEHAIRDNDGVLRPLWTLEDEDGNVDYALDAVTILSGNSIACGETKKASCSCENCGGLLLVMAKKYHDIQYVSRVEPTCTTDGRIISRCNSCGVTENKTIPASHTLEYVHNLSANTLTVKCAKSSSGCTYASKTIDLSRGTLVKIADVTSATCKIEGVAEYSFTYSENGESKTITFLGKTALTNHTIKDNNGNIISVDHACDSHGYFDSSFDAIKYFAGQGEPIIGSTGSGYYICEGCGGTMKVTVINTGK
jgi:hypothetical protein